MVTCLVAQVGTLLRVMAPGAGGSPAQASLRAVLRARVAQGAELMLTRHGELMHSIWKSSLSSSSQMTREECRRDELRPPVVFLICVPALTLLSTRPLIR